MNRYDRQLRLWGKEGQLLLTQSHVCIVGPESVLLQETIKNLVLVGITSFYWFNELSTENRDSTTNLFYDNLIEDMRPLSPNEISIVKQSIHDWDSVMRNKPISLMLLLCEGQDLDIVLRQGLAQLQFPVIMSYSRGLYGYVHVKLNEPHFIIESRPDYEIPSFYLDNPWSELSQYMESIEIESLDEYSLAQLPYIVLLYKVLQHLKSMNETISNKMIKDTLQDWYIKEINLKGQYDLNFDEARRYSHLAITNINFLLKLNELNEYCQNKSLKEHKWNDPYNEFATTLLQALSIYLQENNGNNVLVDENLPDMESSTKHFRTLQKIYQERAKTSLMKFKGAVSQVCVSNHKVLPDNNLIASFYQNVKNIRCIKPSSCTIPEFLSNQSQKDYTPILKALISLQNNTPNPMSLSHFNDKALNLAENYPTSSLLAGLVSEEAIKLITHQYVPIDNTLTYDGMNNEMVTGTF
ncbi:hypothetical protein C6P45_004910 [Maudiozyma exigua]|uniref:NEDD8-activating enzyme E1 regulatory subunit n=1 Tax=Maudiozyma exigua TaxID=34358 RepID=A0A9P6W9L5_MAUEX|nr:hypothetical protein C6P45_004910 [Kazachstania exigua]